MNHVFFTSFLYLERSSLRRLTLNPSAVRRRDGSEDARMGTPWRRLLRTKPRLRGALYLVQEEPVGLD